MLWIISLKKGIKGLACFLAAGEKACLVSVELQSCGLQMSLQSAKG